MSLDYNPADAFDIERYALNLLDHSLQDLLGDLENKYKGKGQLGQILEDEYFHYKPNSNPEPDFPEAGVELKTAPLKRIQRGLVSKERLVFNMIDYHVEHTKTFATSGFWAKNSLLLLMFYLHNSEERTIEHIFKIIRLWRFPKADIKIIMDDWNTIISKIKAGKAHELSEGDTFYLGACTKGTTAASSMRSQPFSSEPARGRAFSLKSKYINSIIEESLSGKYQLQEIDEEYAGILTQDDLKSEKSFEELVIDKFQAHYGKTEEQLKYEFELKYTQSAKNRYAVIARAIMGVTSLKVEEFEKADVVMKTIRLEKGGRLKESMSFAQIKYTEIVDEEWEESYLFNTLTKRFFFVVFERNEQEQLALRKVLFWTMPSPDLCLAEEFWKDTQQKIATGDYEHFIKSTEHPICHVRPKAINARDLMKTPQGSEEKKKAYWLNRTYILRIIQ